MRAPYNPFPAVLMLVALLSGCDRAERADQRAGAPGSAAPPTAARIDLVGAGATFPYPLYARWFNEFAQRESVRVNYLSVGSGEGIRLLLADSVDFGATDAPMTDAELARSPVPIVHIPTVLGAVAVTYNLPGLDKPLRLSGEVLADIFLGRITRWNDSRLIALNPGAALPAREIFVVHRAGTSGTSYIFSDYLASVSPAWKAGPGRGANVRWPVGEAGNGNEGVAGRVKQTIGAIGYLEVVYARQNFLPVAHVRNRAGRFISPMPFEIASAAASTQVRGGSRDLRMSLVDAGGEQSYPIVSFTWILIAPQRIAPTRRAHLIALLRWALRNGEPIAAGLGYVALPTVTANRVLDLLDTLK